MYPILRSWWIWGANRIYIKKTYTTCTHGWVGKRIVQLDPLKSEQIGRQTNYAIHASVPWDRFLFWLHLSAQIRERESLFLVLNQSRAESELRTSNSFVKEFEQPQVYLQHKSFFHRLNWLEKSEISFSCIALKAVSSPLKLKEGKLWWKHINVYRIVI